jgi:hypothetical protein
MSDWPESWTCFGKGKHCEGPCPGYACPYYDDCVCAYHAGQAILIREEIDHGKGITPRPPPSCWQKSKRGECTWTDVCDWASTCFTPGTIVITREA